MRQMRSRSSFGSLYLLHFHLYMCNGDLKDSLILYFGLDFLFKNRYQTKDANTKETFGTFRFKKILVLTIGVMLGDMVQFVCFHRDIFAIGNRNTAY